VATVGLSAALALASCSTSTQEESADFVDVEADDATAEAEAIDDGADADADDAEDGAADGDPNVTGATGIAEDPPDAASEVQTPLVVDSRDDLTLADPMPVAVYEVTTDPADELQLIARFRAPGPECFAVQGAALEDDAAGHIQVRVVGAAIDDTECSSDVESGNDQIVASAATGFGGLGETVDQEMILSLQAPVGQRPIDTDLGEFADIDTGTDTGSDSRAPFAEFANLPLDEATALADGQDITWRISRDNDEFFELSADYDEARVNFEVDEGIVTLAVPG